MSSFNPLSFTDEDLSKPLVDAATLAQIAQQRPDLSGAVRQHPNCYPALVEWIEGENA